MENKGDADAALVDYAAKMRRLFGKRAGGSMWF